MSDLYSFMSHIILSNMFPIRQRRTPDVFAILQCSKANFSIYRTNDHIENVGSNPLSMCMHKVLSTSIAVYHYQIPVFHEYVGITRHSDTVPITFVFYSKYCYFMSSAKGFLCHVTNIIF